MNLETHFWIVVIVIASMVMLAKLSALMFSMYEAWRVRKIVRRWRKPRPRRVRTKQPRPIREGG